MLGNDELVQTLTRVQGLHKNTNGVLIDEGHSIFG
jgi:hypothetical protein